MSALASRHRDPPSVVRPGAALDRYCETEPRMGPVTLGRHSGVNMFGARRSSRMASPQRSAWSRMVIVGKPFFVSRMRWRAAGALALIVALLLTLNGLNVANSYVGRSFISALSERHRQRYFKFALLYLGVFTASTATGVFNQFVQDRLALLWREWLTRQFIDRYLSGHMFDWISTKKDIDNPD